MSTDTNLTNLVINKLTSAQYDTITPSANELYMITDKVLTSDDVILTDTGKIAIAHNASPSATTKSLTLGANGAEYTAEADGWFSLRGNTTSNTGTGINITSNSCSIASSFYGTGNVVGVIYPVYKGQKVNIYYTNVNSTIFRFIYANGSESEYS